MASEKIRYFVWRDGRPRWVPGPKARAHGFKGTDLKDAAGNWLSRSKAREAAEKLNAALDAKVSGTPVPVVISKSQDFSVAQMVRQFLERPKMSLDDSQAEARPGKKPLARSSRVAYHRHGKMLIEWMGDAQAADLIQEYETRILALERMVGRQALQATLEPHRELHQQPAHLA